MQTMSQRDWENLYYWRSCDPRAPAHIRAYYADLFWGRQWRRLREEDRRLRRRQGMNRRNWWGRGAPQWRRDFRRMVRR